MKSEKISINKLIPNPNNPRLIKDDKFKKLVQLRKKFKPIDTYTGNPDKSQGFSDK